MALQTLFTAATGMVAMETKLDVTANNLANMETTGFKKGRCNFEDLFYKNLKYPGAEDALGNLTATGTQVGLGTKVTSIQGDFSTGAFEVTNRQLDVAIQGDGFYRVIDPGGETFYTRAGNFSVNANGDLVMGSAQTGRLLDPQITIPEDATHIEISGDGIVMVKTPNNTTMDQVGRIQLTRFINPEGLEQLGQNMLRETAASGPALDGFPGDPGFGSVAQNMLESSNVEPVNEIISLIATQRAFELNSQVVQTGDQCLQTVTNMKR